MTRHPKLIGLAGYARTGKSTAGQYLSEKYGYRQVAFADRLRSLAAATNPEWNKADAELGYDAAKEQHPWFRDVLVNLGEACRVILGPDVWVDALLPVPGYGRVDAPTVVTDVRYPNEAERIRALGGELWLIERIYVGPANAEEGQSVAALPRADRFIHNLGGVDHLYQQIERALA